MKRAKRTNARNRSASPDTDSKNTILGGLVWFTALLTGILSFLLLFKRKRTKRGHAIAEENKEKESETRSIVTPPDDEPRIFNLRTFGWFAGFLIGMIAFILISAALLSGFFLPGRSIVITEAPTVLPPAPRLEVNPGDNFQTFYATQQAELNSYGWIDRKKGVVHIPVNRAMEILSQSNLPVATGTPVNITPRAP